MHNAPAVSYPAGRSYSHAALMIFLIAAGATVLLVWTLPVNQWLSRHVLAWLLWGLSSGWAALCWWRTPSGVLQFTGECWNLVGPVESRPVTVAVALDLQHTLLVLARQSHCRSSWLWLEQRRQAKHWADLRRALFAHQRDAQIHENQV